MHGQSSLLKAVLVFTFLLPCAWACAQDRKLEISAKASYLYLYGDDAPLNDRETDLIGVGLESVFFPVRFLGVGAFFYEYPIAGYTQGLVEKNYVEFDTYGRSFGLSLQVTSNKNRIFRIYANGKFSYLQLRDEQDPGGFAIYNKGTVIHAGLGVMIKLSRGVNFNLFDASYLMASKELSYSDSMSLAGFAVSSGFTFKMIRAK
jgi:hypothetical protein